MNDMKTQDRLLIILLLFSALLLIGIPQSISFFSSTPKMYTQYGLLSRGADGEQGSLELSHRENGDVTVLVNVYSESGALVSEASVTVPPSTLYRYVPEGVGGQYGTVEVVSYSGTLVGQLVFEGPGTERASSLSVGRRDALVALSNTTRALQQTTRRSFVVQNLDSVEAQHFIVTLFAENGTDYSVREIDLPPLGITSISLRSGYASVEIVPQNLRTSPSPSQTVSFYGQETNAYPYRAFIDTRSPSRSLFRYKDFQEALPWESGTALFPVSIADGIEGKLEVGFLSKSLYRLELYSSNGSRILNDHAIVQSSCSLGEGTTVSTSGTIPSEANRSVFCEFGKASNDIAYALVSARSAFTGTGHQILKLNGSVAGYATVTPAQSGGQQYAQAFFSSSTDRESTLQYYNWTTGAVDALTPIGYYYNRHSISPWGLVPIAVGQHDAIELGDFYRGTFLSLNDERVSTYQIVRSAVGRDPALGVRTGISALHGEYEAMADSDRDGLPDGVDLCLYDSRKTVPGMCGCGNSERANCQSWPTDSEPSPQESPFPTGSPGPAPSNSPPNGDVVSRSDLDGDGKVTVADLESFLIFQVDSNPAADINRDGVVDEQDRELLEGLILSQPVSDGSSARLFVRYLEIDYGDLLPAADADINCVREYPDEVEGGTFVEPCLYFNQHDRFDALELLTTDSRGLLPLLEIKANETLKLYPKPGKGFGWKRFAIESLSKDFTIEIVPPGMEDGGTIEPAMYQLGKPVGEDPTYSYTLSEALNTLPKNTVGFPTDLLTMDAENESDPQFGRVAVELLEISGDGHVKVYLEFQESSLFMSPDELKELLGLAPVESAGEQPSGAMNWTELASMMDDSPLAMEETEEKKCCVCQYYDRKADEVAKFKGYCRDWMNGLSDSQCDAKQTISYRKTPTLCNCSEYNWKYMGHGQGTRKYRQWIKVCVQNQQPTCQFNFDNIGCSTFQNIDEALAFARSLTDELAPEQTCSIKGNQCTSTYGGGCQAANTKFTVTCDKAFVTWPKCGGCCYEEGETSVCKNKKGQKLKKETCCCRGEDFRSCKFKKECEGDPDDGCQGARDATRTCVEENYRRWQQTKLDACRSACNKNYCSIQRDWKGCNQPGGACSEFCTIEYGRYPTEDEESVPFEADYEVDHLFSSILTVGIEANTPGIAYGGIYGIGDIHQDFSAEELCQTCNLKKLALADYLKPVAEFSNWYQAGTWADCNSQLLLCATATPVGGMNFLHENALTKKLDFRNSRFIDARTNGVRAGSSTVGTVTGQGINCGIDASGEEHLDCNEFIETGPGGRSVSLTANLNNDPIKGDYAIRHWQCERGEYCAGSTGTTCTMTVVLEDGQCIAEPYCAPLACPLKVQHGVDIFSPVIWKPGDSTVLVAKNRATNQLERVTECGGGSLSYSDYDSCQLIASSGLKDGISFSFTIPENTTGDRDLDWIFLYWDYWGSCPCGGSSSPSCTIPADYLSDGTRCGRREHPTANVICRPWGGPRWKLRQLGLID